MDENKSDGVEIISDEILSGNYCLYYYIYKFDIGNKLMIIYLIYYNSIIDVYYFYFLII